MALESIPPTNMKRNPTAFELRRRLVTNSSCCNGANNPHVDCFVVGVCMEGDTTFSYPKASGLVVEWVVEDILRTMLASLKYIIIGLDRMLHSDVYYLYEQKDFSEERSLS